MLKNIDDDPVYTITNHHPTKMDALPKLLFKIILAAKGFMRHSCMSPKQQRRPSPFLLSLSFFYGKNRDFLETKRE